MKEDIKRLVEGDYHIKDYLSLTEALKAKDYKIGDKIKYKFNNKVIKGIVTDHFGDGIVINLKQSIYYPDPNKGKAANPMGYNTDKSVMSFELYDGETNPWGSLKNLSK